MMTLMERVENRMNVEIPGVAMPTSQRIMIEEIDSMLAATSSPAAQVAAPTVDEVAAKVISTMIAREQAAVVPEAVPAAVVTGPEKAA